MKKSLLNLLLRGLSVVIKFLLTTYLAKNLSDFEYGEYSLFAFSISFFTILIGMEYFNYNARIFLDEKKDPFVILNDQIIFYFVTYLFTLPFISLLFIFNGLALKWLFLFYLILIIDHLAQEIVRILVLYSYPLTGTFLFFLKSSFWFIPFVGLVELAPFTLDLNIVLVAWFFGALSSLLIGIYYLNRAIPFRKFRWRINWKRIKIEAIRTIPFLFATLSARGLITFDKYILKYIQGEELVGIVSFYFVFAMMMQTAVEAAISAIYFPELVRGYNNKDWAKVKSIRKKMFVGITIIFGASILFSWVGFDLILLYLGKESFAVYKNLLYIYLAAVALQCYTLLPHYKLYAYKNDILILISHLTVFVIGLVLYYFLGSTHGAIGMAISFCIASLILLILKSLISDFKWLKKFNHSHT